MLEDRRGKQATAASYNARSLARAVAAAAAGAEDGAGAKRQAKELS